MDDFFEPAIFDWLEKATGEDLDAASFGVIGMSEDGRVTVYNRWESQHSGLTPSRVLGRDFFRSVGPCTNNHLIAHRFDTEPEFDVTIDYLFTFHMTPSPVTLRMLKRVGARQMYLLVNWR